MSDPEDLLRKARTGDGAALGQMLAQYRNYLSLLARLQIGRRLQGKVDPADLVQETFLEAHRSFARFQGESEGELVQWLRQILAANVAAERPCKEPSRWVRKFKRFRCETGSFVARKHRLSRATKLDNELPHSKMLVHKQPDVTQRSDLSWRVGAISFYSSEPMTVPAGRQNPLQPRARETSNHLLPLGVLIFRKRGKKRNAPVSALFPACF